VTAVKPSGRFGSLRIADENRVETFQEKVEGDESWVSGGFFVLSPKAINRVKGDATHWEAEPLESLAADGELVAYKHAGFWQPMDTLREKRLLETLWHRGAAPWKIW
jgi:glucose-1-phosphate cytidylyltransferase